MSHQVIILAAGEASRWAGPQPKQLVEVEGEPVIHRAARLFPGALVATNNPALVPPAATALAVKKHGSTAETLLSAAPDWGDRTIILFGDTYYTNAAAKTIRQNSLPLAFFTDGQDLFGLAFDRSKHALLKRHLKKVAESKENAGRLWEVYRAIHGIESFPLTAADAPDSVVFIGDATQDFDAPQEYRDFLNGISKNHIHSAKPPTPAARRTVDALVVTYRGDVEWFEWSSQALQKNVQGLRRVVVVAPEQDRAIFDPIIAARPGFVARYIPDWPGAGYYWQQWVKLHADTYTDAEVVFHIDSDAFIREPVELWRDYMVAGKPIWMWGSYAAMGDTNPWRAPTERAFGGKCEHEFMRSFPFVLDRRTHAAARRHLEARHGSIEAYLRGCAAAHNAGHGPQFSEFNLMGCVAWSSQHELYHWVDSRLEPRPAGWQHSRQFWSHAKIADCMPEIRNILGLGGTPEIKVTSRGIWVLEHDTHISRWVEQAKRLDHDTETLRGICRHIKPGDTVVDVGAFIGDHTIAYARATHGVDSGRVLAFEPNPPAFECLRRNMTGLVHVECINAGLSDAPGNMGFVASENVGASRLAGVGTIPVKTLDSYGLRRLDFMKIDAEGMELRILRGALDTIERCRPKMYIEVNRGALAHAGTSPEELVSFLRQKLKYDVAGLQDGPQFDVLCTPEEQLAAQPLVVVLGVSHREVDLARLWLRWVAHLSRQTGGDNRDTSLIIFVNRRTTQDQRKAMVREIEQAGGGMFRTFIAEPPDEQEAGYPGSASHLFVRALEHVEREFPGCATLWVEADTVPMRPSWFREIADEYRRCGKPFMGGQAGQGEYRHMTGNAVYPADWRKLAPSLLESGSSTRPSNYWPNGFGDPWDVYSRAEIMPQMHLCHTIQQIWRPERFTDASAILPETALFHQCKDGSLIEVLARKHPGFEPPAVDRGFTMLNRHTGLSIAGTEIPFTQCRFSAGLGWISACIPRNYYEQLALTFAASRNIGVQAATLDEAQTMIAGRSRLPSAPVNTLRV
jgi:FkbM family methyltransferase